MKVSGGAIIMRMGYLYTLVLGIFSMYIDFERKRFEQHVSARIVAVVLNLLYILSLPFAMVMGIQHSSRTYKKRSMLTYTDICNTALHLLVVLVTILSRWRREDRIREMATIIFRVDARYFDRQHLNERIKRHFDYVIYLKLVNTFLLMFSIGYSTMRQYNIVDTMSLLYSLYVCSVHNIIHGVMFHYFLMMCEACKRYRLLNVHLRKHLAELRRMQHHGGYFRQTAASHPSTLLQLSRLAAYDLEEIAYVHLMLTKMLVRLNDTYKFQTLLVLMRQVFNNVFYAYTMFMLFDGSQPADVHRPPQGGTSLATVANLMPGVVVFVELSLLYYCSDAVVSCSRQTGEILREFHTLPPMDAVFDRKLEMFLGQLQHHKLSINIGGMFDLNMSSSLAMWSFCLRHTFIFVQFEYEYRFREFKLRAQMQFENGVEGLFALDSE